MEAAVMVKEKEVMETKNHNGTIIELVKPDKMPKETLSQLIARLIVEAEIENSQKN